jgi:glycerate-2-kinase
MAAAAAALRGDAGAVFQAALRAVAPAALVRAALRREGDTLAVAGARLALRRNVRVLAFGKAVLGMVAALDGLLHDHIRDGHASIPAGLLATYRAAHPDLLPPPSCRVQLHEGARSNLPDEDAMRAAEAILALAKSAQEVGFAVQCCGDERACAQVCGV